MAAPMDLVWDEKKSSLTTEKRTEWHARTLTGDFTKDKIPNVGPATQAILKREGITNSFQLIGDMMKFLDGPLDTTEKVREFGTKYFRRLVQDLETPRGHSHTVVDALMSKLTHGFAIPKIDIPISTKMDDEKWKGIYGMPKNLQGKHALSGQLTKDFHFIGPKNLEALRSNDANPIKNSYQLLGLFLEHFTPSDPEGSVENFKKTLGQYGPGFQTSAIAAQVVEYLRNGVVVIPQGKASSK